MPDQRLRGRLFEDGAKTRIVQWREKLYEPLDRDSNEIRILRVFPDGNQSGDIVCNLYTIPLTLARGSFTALSYEWGDQSLPPYYITVNGCRVPIGRNAHEALRNIRRKRVQLPIWIDAICIDQENVAERNHQVALMYEIFSTVTKCFMWLGDAGGHTEEVIRAFCDLNKLFDAAGGFGSLREQLAGERNTQFLTSLMIKIGLLFSREFWRRLWIVQEIITTTRNGTGWLIVGSYSLWMTQVLWVAFRVRSLVFKLGEVHVSPLESVDAFKLSDRGLNRAALLATMLPYPRSRLGLKTLFELNSGLNVTDPKDRVYGMLAMMPELGIEPNYNASVSKIYQDATLRLITYYKSLQVLNFMNINLAPETSTPLWASCWCTDRKNPVHRVYNYWWTSEGLWDACYATFSSPSLQGGRLVVMGSSLFAFDEVSQLGTICPSLGYSPQTGITEQDVRQDHALYEEAGLFIHNAFDYWRHNTHKGRLPPAMWVRSLLLDTFYSLQDGTPDTKRLFSLGPNVDAIVEREGAIMEAMMRVPLLHRETRSDATLPKLEGSEFTRMTLQLGAKLHAMRIAISPSGLSCVVPKETEVGDVVYILAGARLPFVLRRASSTAGTAYQIIGPAYVHGLMDGEAIAEAPKWVSTGNPDAYDLDWDDIALL